MTSDLRDMPGVAKVTPEMVRAGLEAYRMEGITIEEADNAGKAEIFKAIFCAMCLASSQQQLEGPSAP